MTYGRISAAAVTSQPNHYRDHGTDLPTRYTVRLAGSPRWRRVYASATSLYANGKNGRVYLTDADLKAALAGQR